MYKQRLKNLKLFFLRKRKGFKHIQFISFKSISMDPDTVNYPIEKYVYTISGYCFWILISVELISIPEDNFRLLRGL